MTRKNPFYQGTNSGETHQVNTPDDLMELVATGFKLPNTSHDLKTYFTVMFEWSKHSEWHRPLLRLFHTQRHLIMLEIFSHIREFHGGYTIYQCQFINTFISQVAQASPETIEVRMASAIIGSCTPEVALCLFYIAPKQLESYSFSGGPKAKALLKATQTAHQMMLFRSKYGPATDFIRTLNLPPYDKDTQTFTL
jgi:hypothetical protein